MQKISPNEGLLCENKEVGWPLPYTPSAVLRGLDRTRPAGPEYAKFWTFWVPRSQSSFFPSLDSYYKKLFWVWFLALVLTDQDCQKAETVLIFFNSYFFKTTGWISNIEVSLDRFFWEGYIEKYPGLCILLWVLDNTIMRRNGLKQG